MTVVTRGDGSDGRHDGPSRVRFVVALAILAAAFVPAFLTLGGLRVENDVDHWLVTDDESTRLLSWFTSSLPPSERLLLSWPGSRLGDDRTATFVAALREQTEAITYVVSPDEVVAEIEDERVPRSEAIDRLRGYLIAKDAGDAPAIGLLIGVSETAARKPSTLLDRLRELASDSGIDRLRIAGSLAIRSQLNREVARVADNPDAPAWRLDRRSPILFSILVGMVATGLLLRNMRAAFAVLLLSIMAVLMTLSLLPATGRSLNIVLLVMPTLVFVVTLSASIHAWNYWRHSGETTAPAASAAAQRTALKPCSLAALTTSIGVSTLALSPLTPVREFGLASACGTGIALLVAVLWLPSLLAMLFRVGPVTGGRPALRLGWLTERLDAHARAITIAAVVIATAGLLGLPRLETESRIIRYFPDDSDIVADYEAIESTLTGIAPIQVVVVMGDEAADSLRFRERLEVVRDVSDALEALGPVSAAVSLADFQPDEPQPPVEASFFRKARWFRIGAEMEKRLKADDGANESVLFRVARDDSEFAGDGDELWGISAHVSLMDDSLDYEAFMNEMRAVAADALSAIPGTRVHVTGTVPQYLRLQRAVLDSLITSFLTAFAIIAVVMMVYLRDPIGGLWLMIPNLLPVVVVFGGLSWLGVTVDIGTMLTASVALGIAVDDSVHLLVAFQSAIAAGRSRTEAVREALRHAGVALVQTTLVLAVGFAVLSTCEMQLISRFGGVMACLLATALLADLFLLPALLLGPLGRRIEARQRTADPSNSVARRPHDAAAQPDQPAASQAASPERVTG